MSGRFRIIVESVGLSLFLCSVPVNAQLLQDTTAMNLVRQDIDYIYNQQFDKAREVYAKIVRMYPGHPIESLLRGFIVYWENYPLVHVAPSHVAFEEDMRQCIKMSETNKNPAYDAEYLLSDLCARGMLLMYYSDNELITEIIPLTLSTYKYLRRSFDFTSACEDLNYFTGVYNYYREEYPKVYPVYKSLAMLFPSGDMELGLKELQRAAKNSVVLRAESGFLLSYIYLNFENKYSEGLLYSKTLHEQYPENTLYLALYIKNLLLMKQYDEAEKLMSTSAKAENKYFQVQLTIFKGILQEKKYQDNKLAQQYYYIGLHDINVFDNYGDEYAAFAYYGLSRISNVNGDKETSKIYRKAAEKLGDFKKNNFDN